MRAFHSSEITSRLEAGIWRDRSGRMSVKERNKFHSNITGNFRPRNIGATVSMAAKRAAQENVFVSA